MREQMKVLEKVILVNLDITVWSGRTKIRPQDLVAVEGKLPPSDLASLGHKKTIDPKELSAFGSIRKEMERACLEVGTRFLGGYAIPEDQFDSLARKLTAAVEKAEGAKQKLLANYDHRIETWIARHHEWANIIRRAVVPSPVVANRIRFDWTAVRVSPATTGDGVTAGSIHAKAEGLGSQLFREVATEASTTYRRSYEGKDKVGQKALRPIKTLRKKMESLRFLDRRIGPICNEVDAVLEGLPKTGFITDSELLALRGLVILLSDEDRMKRAGEKALGMLVEDDEQQAEGNEDSESEIETDEPVEVPDPEPEVVQAAEVAEIEAEETPVEETPMPLPEKKKAVPTSGWFF